MDYLVRTDKDKLDSTGYMEIGLGKYSGQHWQTGFIFIWEDAFGMAEGIILKHMPSYDHFDMNNIPKSIGLKILNEWIDASKNFENLTSLEIQEKLFIKDIYNTNMEKEIDDHRLEIKSMLQLLGDEIYRLYKKSNWVCILGM